MPTATELDRAARLAHARSERPDNSANEAIQAGMQAAQSEQDRQQQLEFLRAKNAARRKIDRLGAEIQKDYEPKFRGVVAAGIIAAIIGDIVDIVAVIFEVITTPTAAGPFVVGGLGTGADLLLGIAIYLYIRKVGKYSKKYSELQALLQSGQKLQSQQEAIQKAMQQRNQQQTPNASRQEVPKTQAQSKAKLVLSAISDPKEFIKKMVWAYILDLIPFVEALPFRTYRNVQAYRGLNKTYEALMKNWKEYQREIG